MSHIMANIAGTFARRLAQEFPTWQVLSCEIVVGWHNIWCRLHFTEYGWVSFHNCFIDVATPALWNVDHHFGLFHFNSIAHWCDSYLFLVVLWTVSFSRLALSWWFSIKKEEGSPYCCLHCSRCLKASEFFLSIGYVVMKDTFFHSLNQLKQNLLCPHYWCCNAFLLQ